MADSETEITLGVGKLVGLFFLLVALCAVSLGIGYSLGRSSAKPQLPLTTDSAAPSADGGAAKPTPQASAADRPDCQSGENCAPNGIPKSQDLSFYKSVQQKDADTQLAPAEAARTSPPLPSALRKAPQPANNAPAVGSGYMVQVAAVSKREDAEVLQDALRRKQYPVLITNPAADKLFHVQIGPFAGVQDAETTRTRLLSDGYNPILKK